MTNKQTNKIIQTSTKTKDKKKSPSPSPSPALRSGDAEDRPEEGTRRLRLPPLRHPHVSPPSHCALSRGGDPSVTCSWLGREIRVACRWFGRKYEMYTAGLEGVKRGLQLALEESKKDPQMVGKEV